ncbi:hypothetical protein [Roseomonas sp. AR75]|uniref:hypothetical protein n=1 Tax=Roseomonas sp. AR75 TaxID=2562311 RepID=UPI0010C1114E|nr:hypothetical protein [Roseomonas sp. AR75]
MWTKLKVVLDRSPAAVLGTALISVAGASGGAATWWFGQKLDVVNIRAETERRQHESNIEQLQRKAQLDVIAASEQLRMEHRSREANLNQLIQDLQLRLASIERRIGDDRSFFDIRSIFLRKSELSSLPRERYTGFLNGIFFVSPPASDPQWRSTRASEAQLGSRSLGPWFDRLLEEMPDNLRSNMQQEHGILWSGPDAEVVELDMPSNAMRMMIGLNRLVLRPVVYVMPISESILQERAQAIAGALSDDSVQDDVAQQRTQTEQVLGALQNELNRERGRESQDLLEMLSSYARGDLAALMMMDMLMQRALRVQLFAPASFEIGSAQKVGNVFYLRMRTTLGPRGRSGVAAQRVYIDEEIIFLTRQGQEESLLIRTFLPSFDGNPASSEWVTRWLATFRVPI